MMLNRSDENGHLCLAPDLRPEAFCLSPLSIMLATGFFVDVLHQVRTFPAIPNLLKLCLMHGY